VRKYGTPSGEHNYNFFSAQRFIRLCEIAWFLKFLTFCWLFYTYVYTVTNPFYWNIPLRSNFIGRKLR